MSDKPNKVTVHVFGQLYNVKGDQDPDRIRQIARLVNEKMRKLAATNSSLTPTEIAVLAALNIADEYLCLEDDYRQIMKLLETDQG